MIYSIKAFFNIQETHTTDKSVINILAYVINNTMEAGYNGMFFLDRQIDMGLWNNDAQDN